MSIKLPIRVSSNSSEDGPGIASVPTLTSLTNGMNTWLDSSSELKMKKQKKYLQLVLNWFGNFVTFTQHVYLLDKAYKDVIDTFFLCM